MWPETGLRCPLTVDGNPRASVGASGFSPFSLVTDVTWSLLQWHQTGRAEGRWPGVALARAIRVGALEGSRGGAPPHLPIQTGLPEASPSPARGRGVSVAGPWGPRAGDGQGDPGLEAFCPAGPELQCRLLRTESLARFQGGKNPSPKRRECCLIKAAAGRRENSPLKKKSLSLEK